MDGNAALAGLGAFLEYYGMLPGSLFAVSCLKDVGVAEHQGGVPLGCDYPVGVFREWAVQPYVEPISSAVGKIDREVIAFKGDADV